MSDVAARGPLLSVEDVKVHFPVRSGLMLRQTGKVKAVDGVSLAIGEGETVGLVVEPRRQVPTFFLLGLRT